MGKKETGFTFIELILVVVILSVIAGLATPRFRNTFTNLTLQNFSQDVLQLIRYAQTRSAAEGISWRINFDAAFKDFWLTRQKEPEAEEYQRLSENVGRLRRVPRDITLASTHPQITFYPDGEISDFTLEISSTDKLYVFSTQGKIGNVEVTASDK